MKKSDYYFEKAKILNEKMKKFEELSTRMFEINSFYHQCIEDFEAKKKITPEYMELMRYRFGCIKNDCYLINMQKDIHELSAKSQDMALNAKYEAEMNN